MFAGVGGHLEEVLSHQRLPAGEGNHNHTGIRKFLHQTFCLLGIELTG